MTIHLTTDQIWMGIGFLGQGLFASRFLAQMIVSERKKESVVPLSFWFLSIGGGVTLLAYAIYKVEWVFIVGQGAGLFVYLRNLMLIRRKERTLSEARPASA